MYGALMSGALLGRGATLGRWDPAPQGPLAASSRSLVRPRIARHMCIMHAMMWHGWWTGHAPTGQASGALEPLGTFQWDLACTPCMSGQSRLLPRGDSTCEFTPGYVCVHYVVVNVPESTLVLAVDSHHGAPNTVRAELTIWLVRLRGRPSASAMSAPPKPCYPNCNAILHHALPPRCHWPLVI